MLPFLPPPFYSSEVPAPGLQHGWWDHHLRNSPAIGDRLWTQLERAQKRVVAAEAGRDAATADLAAAASSARQREHALEAAANEVAAALLKAQKQEHDLQVGGLGARASSAMTRIGVVRHESSLKNLCGSLVVVVPFRGWGFSAGNIRVTTGAHRPAGDRS